MVAALVAGETGLARSTLLREIASREDFTVMIDGLARSRAVPDIVAMGDSRIRHGFNARVVERRVRSQAKKRAVAWNLGRGGVMGEVELALTLRSLEKARPPKVALLYVDPTTVMPRKPPDLQQQVLTKPWRLKDLPAVFRADAPVESLLTIALSASFSSIRYRDWVLDALDAGLADRKPASLGDQGFAPFVPRNGQERHKRAVRRARAYSRQYRGSRVGFTLSEFGLGAIREAIRQYRAAGTRVVLINSAATAPVNRLLTDRSTIGPLFMETMAQVAKEQGVPFLDHSRPPVLTDADFVDGDHLNRYGAARYSIWLTHEVILPLGWGLKVPLTRWTRPRADRGCQVVFDFEEQALEGWATTGNLGPLLAHGSRGMQPVVSDFEGLGLLSTFHETLGYGPIGTASSPPFTVRRSVLRLLVGGGRRQTGVELVVDGQAVRTASGQGDGKLRPTVWDVRELEGKQARLRVFDRVSKKTGYVVLDQVQQCVGR